MAGAFAGGFVALWVIVRDTPPAYIERWNEGATGERMTTGHLAELCADGWTLVDDVERHWGNYDHLLIGPGGVFLLESKNLTGVVEMEQGTPRLRRRHDPEGGYALRELKRDVVGAAVEAHDRLSELAGERAPWVDAVVVFWNEFPQQLVESGHLTLLHGSELVSWLRRQPTRLDQDTQNRFAGAAVKLKSAKNRDRL